MRNEYATTAKENPMLKNQLEEYKNYYNSVTEKQQLNHFYRKRKPNRKHFYNYDDESENKKNILPPDEKLKDG